MSAEVSAAQTEEGRQALTSARDELQRVTLQVEGDKIPKSAKLDEAFAQCHHALALAYEKRSFLAKFKGRKARLLKESAAQTTAAEGFSGQ